MHQLPLNGSLNWTTTAFFLVAWYGAAAAYAAAAVVQAACRARGPVSGAAGRRAAAVGRDTADAAHAAPHRAAAVPSHRCGSMASHKTVPVRSDTEAQLPMMPGLGCEGES